MGIQINLVGLVTLCGDDGRELHLASPRAQVALARLVLERESGITRDQLADTVWPERLPATWCSALRTLVSRIRALVMTAQASSSDPVVALAGRYMLRLPDDVVVDVERAQTRVWSAGEALAASDFALAKELALEGVERLRSPFLPEHSGDWVTATREHLTELLASGLETASQASAGLGHPLAAVSLAQQAANRMPLRESTHRCLMAAHAAGGNRAEALRAYQRLRRILMEELGVDPSDETEAAYLELLGPPAPPPNGATGRRDVEAQAIARPECDRGLAVLTGAWGSAVAKSRQVALVTGDRDEGRARLVSDIAHRAASRGGLVLFGRCDRKAEIPCRPFVEALDGYVAALPEDEAPVHRAAGGDGEAPVAFPSLEALEHRDAEAMALDERVLFDTITEVIVGATQDRPVLTILDDLQWADPATLSLLPQLVQRSAGTRLLLLAVMRDGCAEPGSAIEVVRALGSAGHLHIAEEDVVIELPRTSPYNIEVAR